MIKLNAFRRKKRLKAACLMSIYANKTARKLNKKSTK